jgi:hypothetical protein
MPRTTSTISLRDLEVLAFVARFGLVSASATARSAGTSRSVTYRREERWRKHGLIRVLPDVAGSGRLLACTPEGLRAVGQEELRPARVSIGRVRHAVAVAHVAAELERQGERVLSEREIVAIERREGRHLYSAEIAGGRFHRPDLVLTDGPIGVEVELSQKASWRLDSIMRGWRSTVGEDRLSGVRYLCSERAIRPVKRAVERTMTDELIEVVPIAPGGAELRWDPA